MVPSLPRGLPLILTPTHADKRLPFTYLVCAPVFYSFCCDTSTYYSPLSDDRKSASTNTELHGADVFNPVIRSSHV